MIEIQKLEKHFSVAGERVDIFKDADFNLGDGDFIAIVGPSGSGKSTFLNILSGIDREYTGSVTIDKNNISKLSDASMTRFRGQNISYIFQNFKLIENLTVKENIDLIVDLNKLERNFSTKEILTIVGLENKINSYVYNLSGGESQRVAIARAFVGKTKLLLADEPTGALDIVNKKIVMELIVRLQKQIGNTIVLITHDDEVAELAEKIYRVHDGKLELT
ncbi:ABC transporter ATP-binding protein [Candidatus Gracilibacteria bacterium]|nr:ABC transporter ATP-binding protein [Candidatus Gracilibacteria bacterium]